MYPRVEQKLDLLEIARDWARDMPQHPTAGETLQLLLRAFWRGDLRASMPGSSDDPRERLFNAVRRFQPHRGLLIVDPAWVPPSPDRHLDGSWVFDFRRPIFWPEDPAAQTPEVLQPAYVGLTDIDLVDYSEAVRPLFAMLEVELDHFLDFSARQGFAPVRFWVIQKVTSSVTSINSLRNASDVRFATEIRPDDSQIPVQTEGLATHPLRPPGRPSVTKPRSPSSITVVAARSLSAPRGWPKQRLFAKSGPPEDQRNRPRRRFPDASETSGTLNRIKYGIKYKLRINLSRYLSCPPFVSIARIRPGLSSGLWREGAHHCN
jgi:hypothetical protein